MLSMNTINKAMGRAANTMKTVNKQLPMEKFANDMREFAKESERSDLKSEMIEETLDSLLDVDESEEDQVINQVLDEIGIETKEKVKKFCYFYFFKIFHYLFMQEILACKNPHYSRSNWFNLNNDKK